MFLLLYKKYLSESYFLSHQKVQKLFHLPNVTPKIMNHVKNRCAC